MDPNLAFLAFCITIVALASIAQNKDKLASKGINLLAKIVGKFPRLEINLNQKDEPE